MLNSVVQDYRVKLVILFRSVRGAQSKNERTVQTSPSVRQVTPSHSLPLVLGDPNEHN